MTWDQVTYTQHCFVLSGQNIVVIIILVLFTVNKEIVTVDKNNNRLYACVQID